LLGSLAAIPISGILANHALAAIPGGGLRVVLGIVLLLFMPETRFKRPFPEKRENWKALLDPSKKGFCIICQSSMLTIYMLITLVIGLYSECMIGFALSPNFDLAITLYLVFNIFRSLTNPLTSVWVNHYIDSDVRAIVLSFTGQVDAFGQTLDGPMIGAGCRLSSIRTAIVNGGLVLYPSVPLFGRILNSIDAEEN